MTAVVFYTDCGRILPGAIPTESALVQECAGEVDAETYIEDVLTRVPFLVRGDTGSVPMRSMAGQLSTGLGGWWSRGGKSRSSPILAGFETSDVEM